MKFLSFHTPAGSVETDDSEWPTSSKLFATKSVAVSLTICASDLISVLMVLSMVPEVGHGADTKIKSASGENPENCQSFSL